MGEIAPYIIGALSVGICMLAVRNKAAGHAAGTAVLLVFLGTRAQADRSDGIIVISTMICLLIGVIRSPRKIASRPKLTTTRAMLIYSVIVTISSKFYHPESLMISARLLVITILITALSARFSQIDVDVFSGYLHFLASLEVLLGCVEVITKEPIPWGYSLNHDNTALFVQNNEIIGHGLSRVEGTTGHSIVFGMVVGLALLSLLSGHSKIRKPWRVYLGVAYSVGILLSGSRSVILAVLVCILFGEMRRKTSLSAFRKTMLVGAVIFLIVLSRDYLWALSRELISSGSFSNRFEGIQSSINLISRPSIVKWIGTGFGSETQLYSEGYLQQSNTFRVVDNQFVLSLATGGIFGLLLVLIAFVLFFKASAHSSPEIPLFWALMAFAFDFLSWYSGLVLFLLMSVCADVSKRDSNHLYQAGTATFPRKDHQLASEHESSDHHPRYQRKLAR